MAHIVNLISLITVSRLTKATKNKLFLFPERKPIFDAIIDVHIDFRYYVFEVNESKDDLLKPEETNNLIPYGVLYGGSISVPCEESIGAMISGYKHVLEAVYLAVFNQKPDLEGKEPEERIKHLVKTVELAHDITNAYSYYIKCKDGESDTKNQVASDKSQTENSVEDAMFEHFKTTFLQHFKDRLMQDVENEKIKVESSLLQKLRDIKAKVDKESKEPND